MRSTTQTTVNADSLTFPAEGNEALLQRCAGDILMSASYASPAFLRRVVSVQREHDLIVVTTTRASLTDAIVQGHFAGTSELSTASMNPGPSTAAAPTGVPPGLKPLDSTGGVVGGSLDLTKQVLESKNCAGGTECSVGGGGLFSVHTSTGHTSFDTKLGVGATIMRNQFVDFRYGLSGPVTV